MNPLLDQFLSESRDAIQAIGEKLLQLETAPDDQELMGELFRLVHTLKGNSGLFELPEMTRVLHAAESLMDTVRAGRATYSQALADQLLEAMDFVSAVLDEIQEAETDSLPADAERSAAAVDLARALQQFKPDAEQTEAAGSNAAASAATTESATDPAATPAAADADRLALLARVPEAVRLDLYQRMLAGEAFHWVRYEPEEECFYKGEDPFFQIIQLATPCWRELSVREPWPEPENLDAYRCILRFECITAQDQASLAEHFRYVPDQVQMRPIALEDLSLPTGTDQDRVPVAGSLHAPEPLQQGDLSGLIQSISKPLAGVLQTQAEILALDDHPDWLQGRLRAVAASLRGAFRSLDDEAALATLETALGQALEQDSPQPLRAWLEAHGGPHLTATANATAADEANAAAAASPGDPAAPDASAAFPASAASADRAAPSANAASGAPANAQAAPRKFGRRLEDSYAAPSAIKVDQAKIDRMMNLIGEMIVAKNALPYLAARAEKVFGVRDLAREIKGQYGTIHRIADEMQDAIMQIRLLPVSFVFQRFPRLVRDTAHKLGKQVNLVMEGESTEADKNVIESLADPLVHIIRNSLDHGLETAEERRAAGKPAAGQLSIRARSESDRVVIEIADDGRGIDPETMRRKAYEKGIIDEQTLERLSDQDAVNLVFAAGFSTAAAVSDLSGRGVGMDVVRNAVAQVNGSIDLKSEPGKGTRLRLSLPLSMAVSNVMIIQSAGQRFGISMDAVAETVRVPAVAIQQIKHQKTTVLRGHVMPLMALNDLLGLDQPQVANDDQEFAVLVLRLDNDYLGIIVDDCLETVDIILKPLAGFLGNLKSYAGSALLGDGSVLLVINPRGLL